MADKLTSVVDENGSDSGTLEADESGSSTSDSQEPICVHWREVLGPGLLVCLADTDAGCLIVAAQSGARWGYGLLLMQVILIPVLFMAQELTIRLGIYTKKGHTACIKQYYGRFWAWFACILLVIECVFAMMSEMSGVAAVGELWGLSRPVATLVSATLVVAVVFCGNYRQIEVIGITLGMFELTFVLSMLLSHPSPTEVLFGTFTFHSDSEYIKLITANIGAVIMPWMIYFQQSAVVARKLTPDKLRLERVETMAGSFLTQLVMIGALVTLAAAHKRDKNLDTVRDIVTALEPVLGYWQAQILVSIGFIGGSLCAAFVVSLAAAWAVCEAMGLDTAHSLDQPPSQAPHFYGCFLLVVSIGIIVLLSGVNVVRLNVFVELMDGILVPFAVGFLFFLSTGEALPPHVRVVGWYKFVLGAVFSIVVAVSIMSAAKGSFG